MKTEELKQFVSRNPFRPFTVRLSNGVRYNFETRQHLGATRNLDTLVYFGDEGGLALIDSENIVKVIQQGS